MYFEETRPPSPGLEPVDPQGGSEQTQKSVDNEVIENGHQRSPIIRDSTLNQSHRAEDLHESSSRSSQGDATFLTRMAPKHLITTQDLDTSILNTSAIKADVRNVNTDSRQHSQPLEVYSGQQESSSRAQKQHTQSLMDANTNIGVPAIYPVPLLSPRRRPRQPEKSSNLRRVKSIHACDRCRMQKTPCLQDQDQSACIDCVRVGLECGFIQSRAIRMMENKTPSERDPLKNDFQQQSDSPQLEPDVEYGAQSDLRCQYPGCGAIFAGDWKEPDLRRHMKLCHPPILKSNLTIGIPDITIPFGEPWETTPPTASNLGSLYPNDTIRVVNIESLQQQQQSKPIPVEYTGDSVSKFSRDEGYATASNMTSKHITLVSDTEISDATTVYSDALSLSDSMRQGYMAELRDHLCSLILSEKIEDCNLENFPETLSTLLQAFALRLGSQSYTQMNRDVMFYVHNHRNDIVKYFQTKFCLPEEDDENTSAKPKDPNQISLHDKIHSWLTKLTYPERDDNTGLYPDNIAPHLLVHRKFCFNSPAYYWLLGSLRRELLLSIDEQDLISNVRRDINNLLSEGSTGKVIGRKEYPQTFRLKFNIDWDLLSFIKDQNFDIHELDIGRIITITGSETDAQATSCGEYLHQVWPLSSPKILQLVKDAMQARMIVQYCTLPDDTYVTAVITDKSQFYVVVQGSSDSIAEVGEQLAWLGAALRSSPYPNGVTLARPIIRHDTGRLFSGISTGDNSASREKHCDILYELYRPEKQSQIELPDGRCWHNLFRNPIIVQGYPIKRRPERNIGLEIPLNIMAGLAQTQCIDEFSSQLFIKGFSTILVPTKVIRSKRTIIWHLLYNQDQSRISYLDKRIPCVDDDITYASIENGRHFLGWCGEARYYAGAPDATHIIGASQLPTPPQNCFLQGVSLTRGQVIKGGPSYIVGEKDIPYHISRDSYVNKMEWIDKKYVTLWDEEDKRGWLVNGTSALLHLLRVSLALTRIGNFGFAMLLDPESILEPTIPHTPSSSVRVLMEQTNLNLIIYKGMDEEPDVRLKDWIEYFYNLLEKMIDHQGRSATEDPSRLPRRYLEGWDFQDLALREDPIHSQVALLAPKAKSWIDLTRSLQAITLFARGYGEIIKPADTAQSCAKWATLPKGDYYLACSIADVNRIMKIQHKNKILSPTRLTQRLIWYNPASSLIKCSCKDKGEHTDLAQVMLPSRFGHNLPQTVATDIGPKAAVIFGYNTTFKWCWDDNGDPKEDEVLELSLEEPDFSDSAIGGSSGLSSGAGSRIIFPTPDINTGEFEVGIVCALHTELMAVRALFDKKIELLNRSHLDTNNYVFGSILQHYVVATLLPEIGTNSAASVVSHMKRSFPSLKYCLLVGIAGGIPSKKNDIRLGDVVVGLGGCVQYDLGKALSDRKFHGTGAHRDPPSHVRSAVGLLRSDPDDSLVTLQSYLEDIKTKLPEYARPWPDKDYLFSPEQLHDTEHDSCDPCFVKYKDSRSKVSQPSSLPRVHYGRIASGNRVIKDAQQRDEIGILHNALCVEMEAAGVIDIPCLVIRGICDYADSHKNNVWQKYAAATAAAYAKLLLSIMPGRNEHQVIGSRSYIQERPQSGRRAFSSEPTPRDEVLSKRSRHPYH